MLPKRSVAFPAKRRCPCAAVRVEHLYGEALPIGYGRHAISRSYSGNRPALEPAALLKAAT